ncbi:hypothetical protein Tco_0337633 [Tanacetum coccineum]
MTSSNNQIHNDIMATGFKKRLPMLASEESYQNTTPDKKALIDAEAEAVHMILNGIGNDICSTMDDFPNEMWITIEHLQQGESINIQNAKTKLNIGKEIVKELSPLFESASEEDNDEEQAQRDKQIQKSLALIAKTFKNIYKPTNNLKTSLNTMNNNVDTSL